MTQRATGTTDAARRVLRAWVEKQGHDRCWYYPELFDRLCRALNVPVPDRARPSRPEFEEGCRRYQEAEYGPVITSFHRQRNDSDCFNACLASVTGIPLDQFPLWTMDDEDAVAQWNRCLAVCHAHGWTLERFYAGARAGNTFPRVPAGWTIGSGRSPRGPWDHAVLCYDGRPVFDPHASGRMLQGAPEEYVLPIRLAPR